MPPSIVISDRSWVTPDGTPLFSDISLNFGPGRVGIVGRNGCGKSTLLRILARETEPAFGTIAIEGTVGWMRQVAGHQSGSVAQALGIAESLSRTDCLLSGAGSAEDAAAADWSLEARLAEALTCVGLGEIDPWQPIDMPSGGQRTRLALARVMLDAPDLLLLDEPTNNLDAEGRALVAGFLRGWRGCIIVASHDRAFLDKVKVSRDMDLGETSRTQGHEN